MALTPQDVSRIAHLARLELRPEEHAEMLVQLNDFFDIVARMSAVDASGVDPLYTPLSALAAVELRLRDDLVPLEHLEIIEFHVHIRSSPRNVAAAFKSR